MTCNRFSRLWAFLTVHLQNKALRLGTFFSRFLVFCLIAAVMAGSVPPASAVVIDVGSRIGSFIDWSLFQRDFRSLINRS